MKLFIGKFVLLWCAGHYVAGKWGQGKYDSLPNVAYSPVREVIEKTITVQSDKGCVCDNMGCYGCKLLCQLRSI